MFTTYEFEKVLVVSGAGIDSGSTDAGSNRRHSFPGLKGIHAIFCNCSIIRTVCTVAFSFIGFFCLTMCVDDKHLGISSFRGRSLDIDRWLFVMPCAGETSRKSVEALVRSNFTKYFLSISHGPKVMEV